MVSKFLLVGRTDVTDYVGSKTLYLYNALSSVGLKAYIYDLNGSIDPPPDVTHTVFLPWVQKFDKHWSQFLKAYGRHRILYTDNFYWYDECRKTLLERESLDMDAFFNTIALASSENVRWWPKDRFEHWGVCIDEQIAAPKPPDDYVYVDTVWCDHWSNGVYTAKAVLDKAIPEIRSRYGVTIASQLPDPLWPDNDKVNPEWIDHQIDHGIELENMLAVLAKAKAFVTTHEESLGVMQFESLMTGVPVVTNPLFSKIELKKHSGVYSWQWPQRDVEGGGKEYYIDIDQASQSMIEAVGKALEADRQEIRETSIELYGKRAFIERSGLALT